MSLNVLQMNSFLCVCLYYVKHSWVTADLSRTVGGQWDRVLQDLVYAVPCLCVHVCLCSTVSATVSACVHTHACVSVTARVPHARPFSPASPLGAVSLPVGLGFPCVTMITFTSTIKSRRTQITVTHRGTPPHPPRLKTLMKYDGRICSAQHSLS